MWLFNKLIDLEVLKMDEKDLNSSNKLQKVYKRDIAIIGMYGKFPMADNIEKFWENIRSGKDCIREFPHKRMQDASQALPNSFMPADPPRLCEAGYMDEIDKFDYAFFNLSPIESKLMDPNQRIFLEAVWGVIEEAGYGGKRIVGSKTGVYLGHSSDMRIEYHMYLNMVNRELHKQISHPGNVKSIIASRISYLLDLRGPSIVVDTACSSGLVAIHLACQGIMNGECDMAIAGGLKINLLPVQKGVADEIGIRSPGDRARTFDDSADGTGSGEGVIAIMLKSLSKAINDNDHIYAVVKGSAVNQDGSSVGITAPNSTAQQEVILEAWKNAGVDPESISYIEAHGTATKLGDPIEVSGIERAFRKHTDKKSFCAIGSVKTNIGHLDNAAGLAGLVKLVLSMNHNEIPANIHFKQPNRKINFIDSPVYVNDRLRKWQSNGAPLRGGVSSYGLAGTNCHVVIEEYRAETKFVNNTSNSRRIFTLSAQSREVLINLVERYKQYLSNFREAVFDDICYTASTGRQHFNYRIAIVAENNEELKGKLDKFNFEEDDYDCCYYGEFKIVNSQTLKKSKQELSDERVRELGKARLIIESILAGNKQEAMFKELCSLYVKGAEIDWDSLYKGQNRRKISIPVYPFKRSRCWVEFNRNNALQEVESQRKHTKKINHPLIDSCILKTAGQVIYATEFNANSNWVLGEHKVAGRCVLPGTAYLEMIRQVYSGHLVHRCLNLESVLFISPFIAEPGESREIHVIVSEKDGYCNFTIASESQAGHEWNIHVEGKAKAVNKKDMPVYNIDNLLKSVSMEEIFDDREKKTIIETGPRWTSIEKRLYRGINGQYLGYFKLPDELIGDLKEYYLHPSLMDRSINAVNKLAGDGSYLPFTYKSLTIYGPTPKEFYSYLIRKDMQKAGGETACFDVILMDKNGNVFLEAKDYIIKRVREDEFKNKQFRGSAQLFHEIGWKQNNSVMPAGDIQNGEILVFKGSNKISFGLMEKLRDESCSLIEVEFGKEFKKFDKNHYIIKGDEEDYQLILSECSNRNLSRILHFSGLWENEEVENINELEEQKRRSIYSLFYLARALVAKKYNKTIDVVVLADYVNEVTKTERRINPLNAALFGLAKVVRMEYSNLKCRCIDVDENTDIACIIDELKALNSTYQTVYRDGSRYIDEFRNLNIAREHDAKFELKEQGAYIVSGGLGGLGLEICKFLTSKSKVKIAIISRSKIPDRNRWDKILNDKKDEKMCKAIKVIQQMENSGSEVVCYSADVSRIDEIKEVIDDIRESYGAINGIIHCAGVAGDGFIIRKDEAAFANVINPKINGTWLLDRLTDNDELDFFVLFSSITSILAGQGQGDYAAANAYLDAFADYRMKKGKRTITINWAAWKETGMAVDYGLDESKNALQAIPTDIAIGMFNEILSKQVKRVIVGELNYEMFGLLQDQFPISMSDSIQLMVNEHSSSIKTGMSENEDRQIHDLVIKGSNEEDVFSENERKIAAIWSEVLGLDEVNIYDSFNSLGGDSILSTRLLKKLEVEFPGLVDIADVFAYSTVFTMAEYIDSLVKKQEVHEEAMSVQVDEDLDELLEKLANGEMSVKEAEKRY